MTRDGVMAILRSEAPRLRSEFGVQDLAVFGSVARGHAQAQSDIDVLVRFRGTADFDRFMGLKQYLEDLFGTAVDLVTPAALRPELRSRVEREAIHVP